MFWWGNEMPTNGVTISIAKGPRDLELKGLYTQMSNILEAFDEGTIVYVEEPPYVNNRRIFMQMAQTCGVVMLAPFEVVPVSVSSWKQLTVGNGNATKADVSSWLEQNHSEHFALCHGDQDLYDASAISHYGALHREAVAPG